jgi:hypothetical protein
MVLEPVGDTFPMPVIAPVVALVLVHLTVTFEPMMVICEGLSVIWQVGTLGTAVCAKATSPGKKSEPASRVKSTPEERFIDSVIVASDLMTLSTMHRKNGILKDASYTRRWWSGQSQQTVNLSASAYAGSNPARRTKQKIPNWGFFVLRSDLFFV